MRPLLIAIQAIACVMITIAAARLAQAGGDSCNQEVRRQADPPRKEFMMSQCDTTENCGDEEEPRYCTVKDIDGYLVCVCDGSRGTLCEIGFDYDGGTVDVDGQPKMTGKGKCIQYTCGLPCQSSWNGVPGPGMPQEVLACACP